MTVDDRRVYSNSGPGFLAPLDTRCGMEVRFRAPLVEHLVCVADGGIVDADEV
jgi:hypothetical protein